MRNYEVLRERPAYKRDIYLELKRIEEKGKKRKQNGNGMIVLISNLARAAKATKC